MWLMAGTESNLHVDIAGTIDRKIEALRAHRSQNDGRAEMLEGLIRDWATGNAAAAGLDGGLVEGFQVVHTE
ncbi:MAG: hypothetical protein R2695_06915 [Acidimicrobiales bacterium]